MSRADLEDEVKSCQPRKEQNQGDREVGKTGEPGLYNIYGKMSKTKASSPEELTVQN